MAVDYSAERENISIHSYEINLFIIKQCCNNAAIMAAMTSLFYKRCNTCTRLHLLSQALMLSIGSAVEENNTILTTSLNTRVCCRALTVFYLGKQSYSNILSM